MPGAGGGSRRSAPRGGRSAICRPCRADGRSGARRGRGGRRGGLLLLGRGRRCCRGTGSAPGREGGDEGVSGFWTGGAVVEKERVRRPVRGGCPPWVGGAVGGFWNPAE